MKEKFAKFMDAAMAPIVTPDSAQHPFAAKLAQGGVPVYGENGEHVANLDANHLAEYLLITGVRHNSRNFG